MCEGVGAKKRVEYIWVPEILIDDLVHKGHTKLNMFTDFLNKLSAYAVNSQSLIFESNYTHKNTFMPFVDTNSNLKTKPYSFDIKSQSISESYDQHIFFGTKFRGGQNFFIYPGRFFQQAIVHWG